MPVAILALANICDESTRAVKISQGKIPAQFGAPGSLAFAVESRDELTASGCNACEENLEIRRKRSEGFPDPGPVSYTHLRAHETRHDLVCRLLLEKKKK